MHHKLTNFIFKKIVPIFVGVLAIIGANKFINKFCHNEMEQKNVACNIKISDSNSDCVTHLAGIWISYLDLQEYCNFKTEKDFKNSFENIVNECKKRKLNTLIVQVRPFADALYESKLFPWSHIVSGEQGVSPNFDPLKIMIACAHGNNMKFHAWVNPLRISNVNNPKKLHSSNPCFFENFKNKILNCAGVLMFNPGYQEIQSFVADGVKEIVENYEVDAVQFDDYFYPELKNGDDEVDRAYKEYLSKHDNAGDYKTWRKQNINDLIKKTYNIIKLVNSNVQFGISPSGNINKCIEMGADVNTWVNCSGYIDYICPQIYWSLDFKEMPFEKTAASWRKLAEKSSVKLYTGLALYKVGSERYDNGTWCNRGDIISTEIGISKKLNYDGFMLFSYKFLCNNSVHSGL